MENDHNPNDHPPEGSQMTVPNGGVTVDRTDRMVIRFAGDSGDGMQLTGNRFTDAAAIFGNDLATLPTFPAEIRAPAGTLPGVSSFQIQIADWDILTPGDRPDVLVAMNPAALKVHLKDLIDNGILIINQEAFDERNLYKAGFDSNPLEDGTLAGYDLHSVPMQTLTKEAVKGTGVSGRAVLRSKNFLALGLILWMFGRDTKVTEAWVAQKFRRVEAVKNANLAALKAGYNYGITTESFARQIEVRPAELPPGTYTNVNGNAALSWGLIAGARLADLPLFYASYPITPASEILHELVRHRNFGVKTFQAEDEIAAAGAALGAAFTGSLAVTGTSGPGLSLKGETISLALMTELPMVIVDVQRGGPSTGLPTKPEQSDLFLAVWGRHGESPLPVLSASAPSDAFEVAIEACRIALKYMTPVILLSDGYIATSSEPWRLPDIEALPQLEVPFATAPNAGDKFLPYLRDLDTMARPWALPGVPGLEHRVGGLEKEEVTGNVSYDPANHQLMTDIRAWKIANIANDIPDIEVDDPDGADLLVLSWGSTFSAVKAGVGNARSLGASVAYARIRYLSPFPPNMPTVLGNYKKIMVPEMNMGQLSRIIKAEFVTPVISVNKVEGKPFTSDEICDEIMKVVGQ